jgi:dipeptidase E
MKLLLTSAGLSNESIRTALAELMGKSIGDAKLVFVPTAMHAVAEGCKYMWEDIARQSEIGWGSASMLELTALPSVLESHWLPDVRGADVIMVDGGNTPYLSYWFEQSGFAARLPTLLERSVYAGVSAGSIVVSHSLMINADKLKSEGVYSDDQYGDRAPLHFGSDFTLKLCACCAAPHLNASYFEHVSMADMERVCAQVDAPVYAMDDQTALKVVDDRIEVISEGDWKLLKRGR